MSECVCSRIRRGVEGAIIRKIIPSTPQVGPVAGACVESESILYPHEWTRLPRVLFGYMVPR